MEILLHLGAHRCASTTFQSFLAANSTQLAKTGLTCWTPRRTRNGLMHGLVRHPAMVSVEDERNGFRSIGRIRVEIERLKASGQKGLLISEENILGSMRNNIRDTRLYPLVEERLMRFQPAFKGHKLTIGLSIRSYEDFWTSCMLNLVTRGGMLPTVDLLDFITTQPRRWRSVVRGIARAFPQADIVVWPFERLAGQPDAQLRALWPHETAALKKEETWCNRGVDLQRLNSLLGDRGERLVSAGCGVSGGRWMPFDEDQRGVLHAEYRRDLKWFEAGAEGLARYMGGRQYNDRATNENTHKVATDKGQTYGDGRATSAPSPDRDDRTRTAQAVLFGGRHDGIEERLGRTGAN